MDKQETVTPCVLIATGIAVCFYGLWDFWTADLAELDRDCCLRLLRNRAGRVRADLDEPVQRAVRRRVRGDSS